MSTTIPAGQHARQASPQTGRQLDIALLVIAGAQLMVVLDSTIINVALPEIGPGLHFSSAALAWVVTAYALALGSLLLLGGRLGDLYGRRRVFVTGVTMFAAASLVGGLAQGPTMMLVARAVQGVGAALASPAALALINTTFPAGAARHRAMGVYAMMSGVGAGVGFILGGLLTQTVGWRWTFFINVPIGLFVAFAAPRTLRESEPAGGTPDLLGALTGTLGLLGIVYGLSHAAQQGASWGDLATLVPLIAGLVLLVAFVVIEARVAQPLLPLEIVTDRNRASSLVGMLLIGAVILAMFYFLGLYLQMVLHLSPVRAGFAFLPFTISIVASSVAASSLLRRMAPRWMAAGGALLDTIAMWGFTHLSAHSSYFGGLFPWIIMVGVGTGFVFTPLMLTATHGVRSEDSGAAASALNTAQQIGGAIGLAALSTVFASASHARTQHWGPEVLQHLADVQSYASGHAFWGAVILAAGAVVAVAVGLTLHADELATDEH